MQTDLVDQYRTSSNIFGLRINLKVLKTNVSEVGEALPTSLNFQKDTLFLRGDKSEYISIICLIFYPLLAYRKLIHVVYDLT